MPVRHVETWGALTDEEKTQLSAQIYEVQQGYTLHSGLLADLRFVEHDGHLRVEIFERPLGEKTRLISGKEDHLIEHLKINLDAATQVDAALSFVMRSGLKMVFPY
ncbi:hypothetical protein [Shimia haliotis]|uniref:hypothetical protein n=1 Tax=Shimia haliotis TaxID=1280847 RepID=UPI000B804731|nr:hypothetical protein [Shimia haliotis]